MLHHMHGAVIEAQRVRDAKEKIFGRTWEGQGHLERCTVSSRVRESLPGGPAEGTPCARVEKHEATWPFVSRSDSENTIAGVKGTFPWSHQPRHPRLLQMPVPFMEPRDSFGSYCIPRVLASFALCCGAPRLFEEVVSHLRTEAVYFIFVFPGPSSVPFLRILNRQQTFVAGGVQTDDVKHPLRHCATS